MGRSAPLLVIVERSRGTPAFEQVAAAFFRPACWKRRTDQTCYGWETPIVARVRAVVEASSVSIRQARGPVGVPECPDATYLETAALVNKGGKRPFAASAKKILATGRLA